MFDYEGLRLIWWALLGILLIGFAVMDGFDLGTAALLPIVARNDIERRVAINTVGPVWEGNQVWLILRRRIDLRGLADALRGGVFGILSGDDAGPRGADSPPRRVQVPKQDRGAGLAPILGLGAHGCGDRPVIRVRRRLRQSVRGRSVRVRGRSALPAQHQSARVAQSVCPPGRAGQFGDADAAWRGMAET